MIIWRGWGILVLFIPVAVWVVIPELFKATMPDAAYSASYKYISAFSMLLGAVALWLLGKRLNGGEGRAVVDEQTGERMVLRANHSLFFVNMEYWAIPVAILSILVVFA